MIDCINQHVLSFTDEIAVVARPFVCLVLSTVKISNFPVPLADPVNVVFDMNGHLAIPQYVIVGIS